MIIETATLHEGTIRRSRVITYALDSSSGIHGAICVEGMIEYRSDHKTATLHAGTCTRSM